MNQKPYWLTLTAVLCWGLLNTSVSAQMGGADVRYVSDNSFFVLQIDIQKLLTYEKMGSKTVEEMARVIKKEAKFDLMSLKTITVQFSEGEDPEEFDEDSFAVVMDFTKPIDQKAFLEGMGIDFEDDTLEGVPYHRSSESYAPSVCFPTDKTIVIAMPVALKGVVARKPANSKIIALLNSTDPSAEVKGAFHSNEMYRTVLAEINRELPFKPFNIEKVFGEAQSAVISGNVSSSTPIYIQVECKTEEGAADLAKKSKLLVDLGKASIPLGRESIEQQKKEFEGRELMGFEKFQASQLDMALQGLEVSEKILEASETSSEGKSAFFKVKKMGGLKELIPVIAKMFNTQLLAVDELQEEFELPDEDFEDVPRKAVK